MKNLPYNRADRVAKQIYQIVSSYICERVDDKRLTGLQITSARMPKDLSLVRIYFYVEGGKEKQEIVLKALESIKYELRNHIGREVVLKSLPKIEFLMDDGIENAERIDKILRNINNIEGKA
ncbi:MAG: 30S ribosome-binding factor RbfA [Deltaproteobacteria bacterium]|nr:30S ribosome-binding factor RbfA [Deltaproteobacteria bacterium]